MNKIIILTIFAFLSITFFCCNRASTSNDKLISNDLDIETKDSTITEEIKPNISKEYILDKINPATDSMFVQVPQKYCLMRTEYIHKDVLEPYIAMYEAAALNNINLGLISAYRSFDTQAWLWNSRYYNSGNPEASAKAVLKYIAMPGTSRHHWGTDIDVLQTKLYFFETEEGKKAYQWMCDHAHEYGFYQVYTANRPTGYNEEKWHWTYLPVSQFYLEQFKEKITYQDLTGFSGSEVAEKLRVIDDYVFGIDSLLLNN